MTHSLIVKHFFDASHQLTDSEHLVTKQCARLHGHTYAVKVDIQCQDLNPAGMVIDFKAVKNIIDILDHRHINDVFKAYGVEVEPTAENIASFIARQITEQLGFAELIVHVCEGYKGDERANWAIFRTY